MNLKIIARRLFFFFFCEGMPAKPGAVDYVKKTPEAGTDSIYYDDDGKPETHFVSVVVFFCRLARVCVNDIKGLSDWPAGL